MCLTLNIFIISGLDIGAREKQGNPKVDDGFKAPKEKITCIAASVDVDEEFESSGVEETRSMTKTLDEKKSEEEELKDKGNEEGRFIKFLGPYYMLLITKRRQIGALFRHNVYAVSKKELNLNKELKAGGAGNGFIDRSKVRILLCDNDTKSLTTVKSARQVIDALNAEGPDIDIILTEVDLPMTKGMKLLKYIMRNNELRRIPDIMMSAQDEVSIVVKCLRLGAADYLVKPLRTNELLNLWTHMDDEDDSVAKMKAAEEALEAKQKQKPTFELSFH
ncbi:hypothetical protein GOBAR_DD14939 [Gossypium barbadense]|nr:hypothetical protein GOBAR_DD14939 [Gossypium barbadense]